MRKEHVGAVILGMVLVGGCASTGGTSSSDSFWDDVGDVITTVAGVIGASAMLEGAETGDTQLMQDGSELVQAAISVGLDQQSYGGASTYTSNTGFGSGYAQTVGGQSCVNDMIRSMNEMFTLAAQCEGSAYELESLSSAIRSGREPMSYGDCATPIGGYTQLSAFQECARVYLCGAQALACAIGLAQSGMDCTSASTTCLDTNPVPGG